MLVHQGITGCFWSMLNKSKHFRAGATSGSCFSDAFGGECSGTPDECQDCNKAVNCTEVSDEVTDKDIG